MGATSEQRVHLLTIDFSLKIYCWREISETNLWQFCFFDQFCISRCLLLVLFFVWSTGNEHFSSFCTSKICQNHEKKIKFVVAKDSKRWLAWIGLQGDELRKIYEIREKTAAWRMLFSLIHDSLMRSRDSRCGVWRP